MNIAVTGGVGFTPWNGAKFHMACISGLNLLCIKLQKE